MVDVVAVVDSIDFALGRLVLNLAPEGRVAFVFFCGLILYSFLLSLVERARKLLFPRVGTLRFLATGLRRTLFSEEARLRRILNGDKHTADRLIAMELAYGARSRSQAARQAADRLTWERGR